MSPSEKSEALLDALVAAVRADVDAARARASDCRREVEALAGAPSQQAMAYLALSIDRAYTALEAAFLRIARGIDETVPSGEGWHASLVHQMTLALADRRAAVLPASVASAVEPLRRHRHWLRHAYAATFAWDRMQVVVARAPDAIESACGALEAFVLAL